MDLIEVLQFRVCNPNDSSLPPDFDSRKLLDVLNRLFSQFPRNIESLDTGIPIFSHDNKELLTAELVHASVVICAKHRFFPDWFASSNSRSTGLRVCFPKKWEYEWKCTEALSSAENLRIALLHIIFVALSVKAELSDEFCARKGFGALFPLVESSESVHLKMIFCSFICSMRSCSSFGARALQAGCLAVLFRMLRGSNPDLKGFSCFAMASVLCPRDMHEHICGHKTLQPDLLTTWQVTELIEELANPKLSLAMKAKLAMALSYLELKHDTGRDFAQIVGLLSKLSCDEEGLKSPIQPPQQGVLKRVERFAAGPAGAVTSTVVLEDVRREEVVASDDVTLFGYLGTFIEYPVELNLHWRVVSAVLSAVQSFVSNAIKNTNFTGVTEVPSHLLELSTTFQKLVDAAVEFSQMNCIISAHDRHEILRLRYEYDSSCDLKRRAQYNFSRFSNYFEEASNRLDSAHCTRKCCIDFARWRALSYVTESMIAHFGTGEHIKRITTLGKIFNYVVKVVAASCYLDRESGAPDFSVYYEQIRFLCFFLLENTMQSLFLIETISGIPDEQIFNCFQDVVETFCRDEAHSGKQRKRRIAGAAPGKVRVISFLLDKTLSPFRAHYSAEQNEAIEGIIYSFCFKVLGSIGAFSCRARSMTEGKMTLEDGLAPFEWIYASLLAVTRSPEVRRWNQQQDPQYADHSPLCANTTCGLTSPPAETKACSRCKKVYYCSVACQKSHWKKHKSACSPVDGEAKATK